LDRRLQRQRERQLEQDGLYPGAGHTSPDYRPSYVMDKSDLIRLASCPAGPAESSDNPGHQSSFVADVEGGLDTGGVQVVPRGFKVEDRAGGRRTLEPGEVAMRLTP